MFLWLFQRVFYLYSLDLVYDLTVPRQIALPCIIIVIIVSTYDDDDDHHI